MKALELAKWNQAMADEPKRAESKRTKHAQTAAELRRLAEVNSSAIDLLERLMNAYDEKRLDESMVSYTKKWVAKAKEQQ